MFNKFSSIIHISHAITECHRRSFSSPLYNGLLLQQLFWYNHAYMYLSLVFAQCSQETDLRASNKLMRTALVGRFSSRGCRNDFPVSCYLTGWLASYEMVNKRINEHIRIDSSRKVQTRPYGLSQLINHRFLNGSSIYWASWYFSLLTGTLKLSISLLHPSAWPSWPSWPSSR